MAASSQSEKLGHIEEKLGSIEATINRLDKYVISGNGKPPLMERMTMLESCVERHLKGHDSSEQARKEFWNKVALSVIGVILTNIGVIIFALLR